MGVQLQRPTNCLCPWGHLASSWTEARLCRGLPSLGVSMMRGLPSMSIGNTINKLPIGLKLLLPVMMALIVALGASAWLTATKSADIARDLALEAGKQQAD